MQKLTVKEARAQAKPYVETVFALAVANRQVADWDNKLRLIAEMFDEDNGDSVMNNKHISKGAGVSIINQALDVLKVTPQQRNLVIMLAEKNALALIPWIQDGFEQTCKEAINAAKAGGVKSYASTLGYDEVKIISAEELGPEQLQNLKTTLRERFRAKAEPVIEIDPSLGSGVKLIIGDRVYDQTSKGAEGKPAPKPNRPILHLPKK